VLRRVSTILMLWIAALRAQRCLRLAWGIDAVLQAKVRHENSRSSRVRKAMPAASGHSLGQRRHPRRERRPHRPRGSARLVGPPGSEDWIGRNPESGTCQSGERAASADGPGGRETGRVLPAWPGHGGRSPRCRGRHPLSRSSRPIGASIPDSGTPPPPAVSSLYQWRCRSQGERRSGRKGRYQCTV
jgi:hypothetical protein